MQGTEKLHDKYGSDRRFQADIVRRTFQSARLVWLTRWLDAGQIRKPRGPGQSADDVAEVNRR